MTISNLSDLFHDSLRDVYYAEKKLTKALPKMAKQSANEELAKAFEDHLAETQTHVERIERVFEIIDKPARGKKCEAMEGLVKEGEHVMEEAKDDATCDAGLIAAAQAVEHYEIARYGTLIAWANLLGETEAAGLLSKTLEEEKAADERLSELSEEVNIEAQEGGEAAKAA